MRRFPAAVEPATRGMTYVHLAHKTLCHASKDASSIASPGPIVEDSVIFFR